MSLRKIELAQVGICIIVKIEAYRSGTSTPGPSARGLPSPGHSALRSSESGPKFGSCIEVLNNSQ